MKVAIYQKYGDPEVTKIVDLETPKIKPNEVLVKIHFTTLNRTDCGFRTGKPLVVRLFSGLRTPKYQVLGSEYAGEVIKVGDQVQSFAVGDKVFGLSQKRFGSHAEYISVPEEDPITKMPEGFSMKQCAGIMDGFFLSFTYVKKINFHPGIKILINGATGSIGSAAVQLCKYFKADITAVCRAKDFELVKSLGARRCIDYTTTTFESDSEKYDYIIDAVGKSTFSRCKPLLTERGVYFSTELGPYWQNTYLPLWTSLFSKKRMMFPLPVESKSDVMLASKLLLNGSFQPVIDRVYPLEEIVAATKYVESEEKVGNVLIKV